MSTEANKAVMGHVMEAINAQRLEELAGHAGFWETREVIPMLQTMFADWRTVRLFQVAEDDLVFSYGSMYMTHIATFAGVGATGMRLPLEVLSMDQVIHGEVVQHNSASTFYDVPRALGANGFEQWPTRAPLPTLDQIDGIDRASAPTEANKRVVADPLEALSVGDEAAAQEHKGIDSLVATFAAIHTAFPDLDYQLVVQVAEGEWVGTRATLNGTQTGSLYGIPPTEKAATWDFYSLDWVVDGRIVQHLDTPDWNAALMQLGILGISSEAPNIPVMAR